MDKGKPDIVYSEPVNDIIGKPPGTLLRWGTAVLLLVFVLFIFFAGIIKYPDSIPAGVEITTVNPPVTMVSKISGRIKNLYVKLPVEILRYRKEEHTVKICVTP